MATHGSAAPLSGTVRAVPSKSVTHRALIAAALSDGTSRVIGPLDADDTRVTFGALAAMGLPCRETAGCWEIQGRSKGPPGGGEIQLRESGTSCRLLLAVASLGATPSMLDGAPRLRQRPVRELVDALRELGAHIEYLGDERLPLHASRGRLRGGSVRIAADRSSQFASALMLIAPVLPQPLQIELIPPVVSRPYMQVTAATMRAFGARVEQTSSLKWLVKTGRYSPREFTVEGDHSAASYFLAAPLVCGGAVRVVGLRPDSAQADARFTAFVEQLGFEVERGEDWIETRGGRGIPGFEIDLGDAPDLAPTVAALALFAEGPCKLTGLAHLRLKESDRLGLLAHNMSQLGRPAVTSENSLEVPAPAGELRGATIRTDGDHRMAMAFATVSLRLPGVTIDQPDCVGKSNPGFWSQLDQLRSGQN